MRAKTLVQGGRIRNGRFVPGGVAVRIPAEQVGLYEERMADQYEVVRVAPDTPHRRMVALEVE